MKKFKVYILIKDKKPVYVGCTNNVRNRLSKHRLTKDFDSHLILKEYDNKQDALCAENALIRFISYFGGDEWLNARFCTLELEAEFKGFRNIYD